RYGDITDLVHPAGGIHHATVLNQDFHGFTPNWLLALMHQALTAIKIFITSRPLRVAWTLSPETPRQCRPATMVSRPFLPLAA
ncbi:MAG: hypothetical protein RR574_19445, partial [Comamonas sp.]